MKSINLVLAIFFSFIIASCGGGGGGGATTTQTLSGTAAQGAPIGSASIKIKDKNGSTQTVTTGTDGKYTIDVTGKTPPFLLQVPAGTGYLYSVATATGTANIHPFTDLIIRNWYKVQGSNVETDFSGTNALAKVPTATEINTIEAVVTSILSTYLANVGIATANFNMLTSPFDANHTGFDKVLDNTKVAISTTGAVTVTATDPTIGITGTMVSTDPTINLAATDITKPSDPTGLSAIPASTTSIVLVWNASTDNVGVAGYNIYRDTTKVGTSPYPVYSDAALTSSANYCYQVEAFDGAGNVSLGKSASACATTLAAADTTAPSAPTSLTATTMSASQIDLSWTASTDNVGVAGYAIYRGGIKVASVNGTSYSDTGLSSGTLYSYTVKALDGALNYSVASNTASATTQPGIPAIPTGVSATAGDGQVTLSWTAVSGATSYNIYWSTTTGVTKANGTKITGSTSPYTHTGRTNGTAYYYVVTAVNVSGESAESTPVTATPTAPVVVDVTGTWTASMGGTIFTNEDGTGQTTWLTLALAQSGTTVSGNWSYLDTMGRSGVIPISSATVNGNILSFYSTEPDTACAGRTLTWTATVVSTTPGSQLTFTTSAPAAGTCVAMNSYSLIFTKQAASNYAGIYSGTLTTNVGSGTFSVTVDNAGAMNGSVFFNSATPTITGTVTSGGIVSFMLSGKSDTYSGTINAATGAFAASCTSGCVDNPIFTGVRRATVGTAFPIANTSRHEMSIGAAFDGTNFLVGIEGDATSATSITAQLVSKTGALVGSRISTGGLGGAPGIAFDGANYLLVWHEDATYSTAIFGQLVSTSGALVGTQFTIASGYNNVKSMRPIIFDGTNYFVAWHNESTPGQGDTTDVYGQFVTPSGALLGSVIPISTAAHGQREPSVAFDGTNILAIWVDGRNQSACSTITTAGTYDGEYFWAGTHCYESDIYGQLITKSGALAAGTLSGSNFLISAGTLPRDNPLGLAFDGTNYLVTFVEETTFPGACPSRMCDWEAYGILVSQSGAAIGTRFVLGSPTINHKMLPLPTYLGTQYLVTWTDGFGSTSAKVKGQYITTSGAASGAEFTLFSPSASGAVPWLGVVFTGSGVNLAVTNWGTPDASDPGNMDIYTNADVMGTIITFP